MMPLPTVTAIITTFNRKRLLASAIQSVLDQSFPDFELLILDNSSTDGTERIVQEFSDGRVRYVKHPPVGISEQRNLGLKEAKGAFIGFLDDDDEWLPHKLEKQLMAFENGSADLGLVYGGFVRIDVDGNEFGRRLPVLRGRILRDLLWGRDAFTGSASNPLMKTAVLHALKGYNTRVSTSEDWELYLRLTEAYEVDYVSEIVVRIRTHYGPRLGDRVDKAREVEEIILHRYGSIMDRKMKSLYLQKIGGKLCRTGSLRAGRGKILEAIKVHPFNLRGYLQYCLSLLGANAYRSAHAYYKSQVNRRSLKHCNKMATLEEESR